MINFMGRGWVVLRSMFFFSSFREEVCEVLFEKQIYEESLITLVLGSLLKVGEVYDNDCTDLRFDRSTNLIGDCKLLVVGFVFTFNLSID